MDMRKLKLNGISYIDVPVGGTGEWYYGMDFPTGDLYEAEEVSDTGRLPEGTALYLIHYPDGEVCMPIPKQPGLCFGYPVCHGNTIYLLSVDFAGRLIRIHAFDGSSRALKLVEELPLDTVKNCYNLMLHTWPLTLSRQPNDGTLDLIWPERHTISIGKTESFNLRCGDRILFTAWYEDPDYREETVARDVATGAILDRFPGDVRIMPNGELWHIS